MSIELKNVKKNYKLGKKNVQALRGINLKIEEGELFSIVGPNGAGKSTIVRILCGSLRPTNGTIRVNGFDILKDPVKVKSSIGYLPEEPNLYERLTAWELLDFFGNLYDVPNLDERIKELLNFIGLIERSDYKISTFSKGMRQRLAIARALLNDPSILILDEPTMGLDPGSARIIREFIYNQKGKKTILLCTHYLEEAEELCDRMTILNYGKIAVTGKPSELKKSLPLSSSIKDDNPTLEDAFVFHTRGGWED